MKKVLVVVDMLNDFTTGTLESENVRNIIPAVKSLVDEYRENDGNIIWLCDNHDKDDEEFERFPKHAVAGTWGALIIDEMEMFKAKHEYIIPKKRFSGFYNTKLDHVIGMIKPDLFEFVGCMASICIMDTVGGATNRDMKTRVISDAIADFDDEGHKNSMSRMKNIYGSEIITSGERKSL